MESHEQEYHDVPNGTKHAWGWREQVQLLSPNMTYA